MRRRRRSTGRFGAVALLVAVTMLIGAGGAAAAPVPQADYRFEGNLRSSVGSVSRLVQVGSEARFVTKPVAGSRQGVWRWSRGTGLRLNDGLDATGPGRGTYTFVMVLRLDTVVSYRKLIHLGAIDDDDGFYVYSRTLLAYPQDASSEPVIRPDVWYQIAITRDRDGNERFYVDGDLVLRETDPGGDQVLGPDGFIRFLIDDESTTGEQSGGMIARLRIYDGALSGRAVRRLDL